MEGHEPPLVDPDPLVIYVVKDIHLEAVAGLGKVVGMSEFYQTLSQTDPIPEPATMLLLGLGGVGVLLRRKRR